MWCRRKHGNKHINIDQTESTLFCWGKGNPEPDEVRRYTSEDFLEMTSSSILTAGLRRVLESKRSKNPPNRWKLLAVFPEKWEYLPGGALAARLTCSLQMCPCWENLCSWHPGSSEVKSSKCPMPAEPPEWTKQFSVSVSHLAGLMFSSSTFPSGWTCRGPERIPEVGVGIERLRKPGRGMWMSTSCPCPT